MGLLRSMQISGSALLAQRLRLDVISNNVANMNTTRTADGGPYKRQSVRFEERRFRWRRVMNSMFRISSFETECF